MGELRAQVRAEMYHVLEEEEKENMVALSHTHTHTHTCIFCFSQRASQHSLTRT